MLSVTVLASGSSGNALLVRAGGCAVLVDAGRAAELPKVEAQARAAFAAHGRPENGVSVFEQPVRLFHYHRS